jgi:hypothetical protein
MLDISIFRALNSPTHPWYNPSGAEYMLEAGRVGRVWYWTKPQEGYYCLSDEHGREVLRKHAIQLRDAGVDFVFIDATNWSVKNDKSMVGVVYPLEALQEEWSKIPGAPKIAPFLTLSAVKSESTPLVDVIDERLSLEKYKDLLFRFKGKPLMLAVDNVWFPISKEKYDHFSEKYTIRKMWSMLDDSAPATQWSLKQPCRNPNFRASKGTAPCNQRISLGSDTQPEQISVTAAYQNRTGLMSDTSTAVPRFGGKTFQAQMKQVDQYPDSPIVTIAWWNQWIAMRQCYKSIDPNGKPIHLGVPGPGETCAVSAINGNPIMPELWSYEFSNDFEPSTYYGDSQYQLLKAEIFKRRQGIGMVAQASLGADGQGFVTGWACLPRNPNALRVRLTAGPNLTFVGEQEANLPSGPIVQEVCENHSGTVAHHYKFVIPNSTYQSIHGQPVYVTLVHPFGGANTLLTNSGRIRLP